MLTVEHESSTVTAGVHPQGMIVTGGVIWWGMREPRVPQIMCHKCVAEMEASGEFNSP